MQGLVGLGQLIPAPVQADEGFLYDVLCGRPAAEHDHGEADEADGMGLVQSTNGALAGVPVTLTGPGSSAGWQLYVYLHKPETPGPAPSCLAEQVISIPVPARSAQLGQAGVCSPNER